MRPSRPSSSEIEQYNAAAKTLMEQLGVQYNDLYAVAAAFGEANRADWVHFDRTGSELLADAVIAAVGMQSKERAKRPMNSFEKSKWIWLPSGECDDQYAEFFDTVTYVGGPMSVRLSADSDYTLFVNGTYAASGQYGDFEHDKIYDTIDITPFLRDGENSLTFLVYHCGTGTSRYAPAKAGLIYEIASASGIAGFSSETTQCRQSPFYQSGFCRCKR